LKEAIELDPRSRVAHLSASSAYIELDHFDEALREARIAHDLCPANSTARANTAYALARAGRLSDASEILSSLVDLSAKQYVPTSNIALICTALGRTDDALTWLGQALEQHDPWLVFLAADPKWKNLRQDPRYLALLRRLNLPTAWPQGS
jgi:Flp pilus assembly protein TadD